MTAPNMSTITESLERSLRNCSLNNHQRRSGVNGGRGIGRSSSSDDHINNNDDLQNGDATLELNSHMSLPYHWEQCLDLKTGEIYYINWRNGMKAKEDPRTTAESSGDFYYSEEEEEEDEDEDEDSSYDSEESTSESSPAPSSKEHYHRSVKGNNNNNVLVVAGCKSCLMYFMVPKQVEDCPKCNGQLLHFDRSENESP